MNILVIDCAVSRLSIGLKTENKFISQTYDIGMRQSEILIPTIDEILKKAEISASDLDYSALTIGPGSFTGLRLGVSALKAIELSYNVPIFGISSLKVYSYAYEDFPIPVLTCIDANKDKFYASITENNTVILEDGDYEVSEIAEKIKNYKQILLAGPDAAKLHDILLSNNSNIDFILPKVPVITTEALTAIAEEKISKGEPALQDYDGPVYLRASEAEIKLQSEK